MGKQSNLTATMPAPESICALRLKSWAMIHEVSGFVVSERLRQLNTLLAKYSPTQPRVPADDPAGGQWTSGSGGGGISASLNATNVDTRTEREKYPDAIEPVYPLENLIIGLYTEPIISAIRTALSIGRIISSEEMQATGLTDHGAIRVGQREISRAEIQEAKRTALEKGNVITKLGKYGTPQNVYRGSNGVTVIIESSGRNAGKVITLYRH